MFKTLGRHNPGRRARNDHEVIRRGRLQNDGQFSQCKYATGSNLEQEPRRYLGIG
jgi:hypothetical protein